MTIQLSIAVRNARLDAIETTIGTAAKLYIRSGAQPVDCATADSGTVLATMTLPSDYMNGAASGQKTKLGTWEDTSADADGTAGHFRIKDSGDVACHMQGSCGDVGGEDLVLDNAVIATGQQVTITTFTLTDGNA